MKNKQIYKILLELNNIGITENYEELKKEILLDDSKEGLDGIFSDKLKKLINNFKDEGLDWVLSDKLEKLINNFKDKNKIYIDELINLKYIEKIFYNENYPRYYLILTDKGKIFLENYDNSNHKKKSLCLNRQ